MSENPSPSTSARDSARSASPLLTSPCLGARDRLAVQRAHTQLRCARAQHSRQRPREFVDRRDELMLLEHRLGTGQDRLRLGSVVRRDAAREETGVDPEPKRQPLDRLRRGARLAPLDLGDVLLGEAVAREPRLRKPCCNAQLAQAFADARRAGGAGRAHSCGARSHTRAQHAEHLTELQSPEWDSPPKGGYFLAFPCQPAILKIT